MSTDELSSFSDDPQVTAYTLGELADPAECARIEAQLAASPEARAELTDLRAFTAALSAEYDAERAAAEAAPVNVVRVPASRWVETLPWFQLAALLVIVGVTAATMFPRYLSVAGRSSGPVPRAPVVGPADSRRPEGAKAIAAMTPSVVTRDAGVMKPDAGVAADAAPLPPAYSVSPLLAAAAPAGRAGMGASLPTKDENLSRAGERAEALEKQGSPAVVSIHGLVAGPAFGPPAAPGTRLPAQAKAAAATVATFGGATAQTQPSRNKARVSALTDPDIGRDGQSAAQAAIVSGKLPVDKKAVRQSSLDSDEPDPTDAYRDAAPAPSTAEYAHAVENDFLPARENPLSTFSIDVDTASYSIVRRFLDNGSLPPKNAVRIEELINYFPYDDAPPAPESEVPFAIHLDAAGCPWNPDHRLVRIAIKGREIARDRRPPSNLVFLLDVSGSMMPPERLPLIKQCLRLLVEQLREDDHVAIVIYAGESGLALPSTSGDHKETILRAIENLHAGGSTNGASGIRLAYRVARANFIKGGTNRVILSTDGDFNVGVTSRDDLLHLVERERQDGVSLSVLGVGTDNLQDATMQILADHGNGNYAYLDRVEEGRKVLVDQMSGTLVTIAKDVKIQVEFNPALVASYRLIGYEKRLLRKEDFNDDRVDAGEIGAGHSVTALYEVAPAGQPGDAVAPATDPLKYQPAVTPPAADPARPTALPTHEWLTVKMRYKAPDGDHSDRTQDAVLTDRAAAGDFASASADFRFASAVASFGMVLRDSPHKGDATLGSVLETARAARGEDPNGYREGFVELVRSAQALQASER